MKNLRHDSKKHEKKGVKKGVRKKGVLTDASAAPRASPVCELPLCAAAAAAAPRLVMSWSAEPLTVGDVVE